MYDKGFSLLFCLFLKYGVSFGNGVESGVVDIGWTGNTQKIVWSLEM